MVNMCFHVGKPKTKFFPALFNVTLTDVSTCTKNALLLAGKGKSAFRKKLARGFDFKRAASDADKAIGKKAIEYLGESHIYQPFGAMPFVSFYIFLLYHAWTVNVDPVTVDSTTTWIVNRLASWCDRSGVGIGISDVEGTHNVPIQLFDVKYDSSWTDTKKTLILDGLTCGLIPYIQCQQFQFFRQMFVGTAVNDSAPNTTLDLLVGM